MPDPAAPAVDAYWQALHDAAGNATASGERHAVTIAGHQVALHSSVGVLAPVVLPALAHLAGASAAPVALTVHLVDGAAAQAAPQALPWPVIDGQAWTLQTDRFLALHLPVLDSVLWYDRRDRIGIYWLPDARHCPLVERGSPLLTLWAWWLADLGLQLTHAAAVAGRRGAALLVGQGGSGKSTTALLTVGSSLRYLADDYCITDPLAPAVHSLYCSGKVAADEADRFAAIARYRAGADHEKALFFFHPSDPGVMSIHAPLRAIFVPVISGRPDTTYAPVPAMAALRAAAPSTVLQLRVGTSPAAALTRLKQLTTRVPAYQVNLGTDRQRIPSVLAELLD